MHANTIDEVIVHLDTIIRDAQANNDPAGYFAALYRKVTVKVKEGIAAGFFEDGPRMERLDVVFANRYLTAYAAWRGQTEMTLSWQKAFQLTTAYWPIVLQHLLMGINAHINLDLGIAAAEISRGHDIQDLSEDFKRINKILADLVDEVEEDLAKIWPTLRRILRWTRKVDNFLVDFSMELARDGAWRFAVDLAGAPEAQWPTIIARRDAKVARNASLIHGRSWVVRVIFSLIRLGERGTVAEKIEQLARQQT